MPSTGEIFHFDFSWMAEITIIRFNRVNNATKSFESIFETIIYSHNCNVGKHLMDKMNFKQNKHNPSDDD